MSHATSKPNFLTFQLTTGRRKSALCETHILVVLQENLEVSVFAQNGVGGQSLQKDFVHLDSFLEHSQVFSTKQRKINESFHAEFNNNKNNE